MMAMSEARRAQLRVMWLDVVRFLDERVTVLNVAFLALLWAGLTIAGAPDIYAATVVERVTGIGGGMYGAWLAVAGAIGLAGRKSTHLVVLVGLMPMVQHTLWSMIYAAEATGNALALPMPFYFALVVLFGREAWRLSRGD
jgi:hypothetical protein